MAESSAGDFTVGKIQKNRGRRVAKMYGQQKRNIIHTSSAAYEQDHSAATPPSSVRNARSSFDHLVGEDVELRRDGQAKRGGGLAIDHQIELGDLLPREVGGLLALENAAAIGADLAIGVQGTAAITGETTGRDKLPEHVDRRQGMIFRKLREMHALAVEQWIDADH